MGKSASGAGLVLSLALIGAACSGAGDGVEDAGAAMGSTGPTSSRPGSIEGGGPASTVVPEADASASTTTSSTVVSTTVPATTTTAPLGPGASGPVVEALQARLAALGYSVGALDGRYGGATTSAVMAFQKVEGLSVDGVPGPETLARLDGPQGAVPAAGSLRIEIDLARQVLFVVTDQGTRIFNTSTGNNEPFVWPDGTPGLAYTPTGAFAVYHRVDGVDDGALGAMYRPLYFHTDWAVHGSGFVPAYPASHGCARVSNADQDWIWDHVPTGTPVVVY